MLRQLHIKNLAILEDVTVELEPGLNVFTGETGAGKSLIIGAFELLLGLRGGGSTAQGGGADMVRKGADEARVNGIFEIHSPSLVSQLSEILDMSLNVGDELLITRKLFASGRTSVSVNGEPTTAAMLRSVGQQLVDIHGQHDHQYLLRPSNQLNILDHFGGTASLRETFAEKYHQWRQLHERRDDLQTSRELRRQQLDLYLFQAHEIDQADPHVGELPELEARHAMLSNLTKIRKQAGQVHAALYDSDNSAVERLQMMTQILGDLAELDEQGLGELSQQVREATLSLQEAAYGLSRYVDRLDVDPSETAEVEERLNLLNRLAHKYARDYVGDDAIEGVVGYREQIGEQIEHLQGDESDASDIDQAIEALAGELQKLGMQLTSGREKAAGKLKPLIEKQLAELGMSEAKFGASFQTVSLSDDEASASGLDRMEFLIQPNPGQDAQPLRRIASGGELSRTMLALKSIFAGSDRISVLVFDEIDANIGGRLGSVIGRKLRELAGGGHHQVLCITHLPQIAAFGNQHLRIRKQFGGKGKSKQTRTTVTTLSRSDRIEELAEMMTGKDITDTARKQAEEMLKTASG